MRKQFKVCGRCKKIIPSDLKLAVYKDIRCTDFVNACKECKAKGDFVK